MEADAEKVEDIAKYLFYCNTVYYNSLKTWNKVLCCTRGTWRNKAIKIIYG